MFLFIEVLTQFLDMYKNCWGRMYKQGVKVGGVSGKGREEHYKTTPLHYITVFTDSIYRLNLSTYCWLDGM